MAKKSRLTVSRGPAKPGKAAVAAGDRLRALCTTAERKLLAFSDGPSLAKATHAEVQEWLKRARELRDKWRGLLGQQNRTEKRAPRATAEANARSREKADLFHGAVQRFEDRLASLLPAATPTASRKVQTKRGRTAAHRTARAGLRAELSQQVASLNRAMSGRSGGENARVKASAAPAAKAAAAKPSVAKSAAAGVRRAKRPAIAAAAGGEAQAIGFDRSKQRVARTKAKHARIKLKGISTRRGGHVLASGKRAQARRDKRAR